ncbi:MAG: NAD(P)/FAD-dependent oxidoreductase [Lachnospiraceae bacterium]|nr:NAD(P)/FAD-dependent oxidoreductase [Lachnospiraceae bacterium]
MSIVAIIGGGAAGMMAAYAAGQSGHQVHLFDGNEKLGKKIYITGKGRCNFTNAISLEEYFNGKLVTNPKFLYSALYTFSNDMVMDFMEQHGCLYKIERGDRVFPVSDHASDVTMALKRGMEEVGVSVHLNNKVKSILTKDGCVQGIQLDCGKTFACDAVVLATGGKSYPTTGSTGDGYRFATDLGIDVIPPRPALVPFVTKEGFVPLLQGLSLRNVTLSLYDGNKRVYSEFGEMLFTHFGISGPLVLTAASYVGKRLESSGSLRCEIDLKPALSDEQLDDRLLREISENGSKSFRNYMAKLLPGKMVDVFVDLTDISPDKKARDLTAADRESIRRWLRHFTFTITGLRGFKEAIVTQGGISVKEIDPSTMAVKKCSGLYACGEVLDVDAVTGGFNLQIAFSTGYLAGISIE